MKIEFLNNSSTNIVKNKLSLVERALLVSIIALVVIETILLALLLTGMGGALPLTIFLVVFFVISVILTIVLISFYITKGLPKVGEPQESPKVGEPQESPKVGEPQESPKVGEPQESPKVGEPQESFPPPSTFPILILREEEKKLLSEQEKNVLLMDYLQELPLEEVLRMHIKVFPNPVEKARASAMKDDLEQWVKDKVLSLAYLDLYCPDGDGDCLLSAVVYAMRQNGLEVPNPSVLRNNIVNFLKDCLLRNNVCLMYLLNDLVECLLALDKFSLSPFLGDKTAIICQKCSLFSSDVKNHTVPLDILTGNNITGYLTTCNSKHMEKMSLLLKFLDLHNTPGVFFGPSAIYALAYQLGITILLYTSPPLAESTLTCMGEIQSGLSLFMNKTNRLAVGGLEWEKNVIVFNPEAKSENPICLGLVVNHFVVLNMEKKN